MRTRLWLILLAAAALVALLVALLLLPATRAPAPPAGDNPAPGAMAARQAGGGPGRPGGAGPGAAPGQGPGAGPPPARDEALQPGTYWKMAPGFEVVLDPYVEVECRIFQSQNYQRLLLMATRTDVGFLMDLKSGQVSTFASASVIPRVNGLILPDTVRITPAGRLETNGADVRFRVGEGSVLISPQPPLVGEVTLQKILEVKKEYAATARNYNPAPDPLARIRACRKPTDIVVFFGTWCPHCRRWMPPFLRTMELANNPNFRIRYFAVDEEFTTPHDEIWKYNAHVAPTIILLRNGKELGRIKEQPIMSIEQDIADILTQNP